MSEIKSINVDLLKRAIFQRCSESLNRKPWQELLEKIDRGDFDADKMP